MARAQTLPIHGIDVSRWQGRIDWAAVRGAGTQFEGLWFNQASLLNEDTPLKDPAVREARGELVNGVAIDLEVRDLGAGDTPGQPGGSPWIVHHAGAEPSQSNSGGRNRAARAHRQRAGHPRCG